MSALSDMYGLPVNVSTLAVTFTQHRFPVSKRRRIRKKWAARSWNKKTVPGIFTVTMNDEKSLLVHPDLMPRLMAQIDRQAEAYNNTWR